MIELDGRAVINIAVKLEGSVMTAIFDELDGRTVINIVVAIIDTPAPAIKRIIERYYTVTKRKRATIDIVDAATKATVRCTIVRDFAIVQCKRTMIIENAAASECGVARDPAIDDIDRTSVITPSVPCY